MGINIMSVLGVIGGNGPLATAYFQELIIKMTDAGSDQEHLNMIIFNITSIPDRTQYILDHSRQNPTGILTEIAKKLEQLKVNSLVMPCITGHYFYDAIVKEINIPFIHAIKETRKLLTLQGIRKVGLMATEGTVRSGLFQKELNEAGICVKVPPENMQRYISELIYKNVKAGISADTSKYGYVMRNLLKQDADIILLGCTELSVINKKHKTNHRVFDILELLSKRSIEMNGLTVRREYENLF